MLTMSAIAVRLPPSEADIALSKLEVAVAGRAAILNRKGSGGFAASVDLLVGFADFCLVASAKEGHLFLLVLDIGIREAIGEPVSY